MSADLRWVVERDEPYALVRLVGALDLPAAESLRCALLTCLADQPDAVIVDVSQLSLREAAALAVFAAVAHETATWAGARLLLCAPPPRARELWARARLAVTPTRAAALAQLAHHPEPETRLCLRLPPVAGSARRARELLTEGCLRWGLIELAGPGCIALTELVTNVVAHARTPMLVRLAARGGALHVAVRDYCARLPVRRGRVAVTRCGGRGLLLVDAVAARSGSTPLRDGKVVWAVLQPDDEVMAADPVGPTVDAWAHG